MERRALGLASEVLGGSVCAVITRRGFLALASGLLVPEPPRVRTYAFAPVGGWRYYGEDAEIVLSNGRRLTGRVTRSRIEGDVLYQTVELVALDSILAAGTIVTVSLRV